MADGRCQDMSAVDILKATAEDNRYGANADGVYIGATWRIRLKCMFGGDADFCQITLTTSYYY